LTAGARLISRIVAWSCDAAWAVVLAGVALTVAAVMYAAGHFSMTTDTAKLISPDLPWRQNEMAFDRAFPQQDDMIVAVIDGVTPEKAEQAAAKLAAALASQGDRYMSVRRPDGGPFFDQYGLMLLPVAEVEKATGQAIAAQPFLGALAADPSLRGVMGVLNTTLLGVQQGQARLDDLAAPFNGFAEAMEEVADGKPTAFSWRNQMSGQKAGTRETRKFILVRAKLDYGRLQPGKAAGEAIHATAKGLGLDAAHGVTVRLTGSVPLSDEEFGSLAENVWLMTGAMLAAIVICLWLAVRSGRLMIAILVVTIAGLIVTAALGLAAVGRFNLISVAFIPLFVGLGVDFGIQFCVRYKAERLVHPDLKTALVDAGAGVGGALALAAAAIAVGFFAFLPTDYVGVSELGVIAGLGMLIAFVLSVTLLPALLMLMRPKGESAEVGFSSFAPLDDFVIRRRKLVLLVAGGAALVCLALLPLVRFDFNPFHLRNERTESMAALGDLMKDPDRTPNTIDVLAPNLAAADALAARLSKLPEVSQAVTLSSFVPGQQDEKLALIGDASLLLDLSLNPLETAPPPTDAELVQSLSSTAAGLRQVGAGASAGARAAARLADVLDRLAKATPQVRATATRTLIEPLETVLNQLRATLTAAPLTRENLPKDLVDDWVGTKGIARVQVFPKGDSNDNRNLERFSAAVRTVAPDATGTPISIQEAGRTIVTAFLQAGALSFVAIVALLFAILRRVKDVLLTMAPVILTGLLTLGSSMLLGWPINFANIIALPLLFGIGVAFNIYFVMAWRGGATDLLQSSLTRAVLFSALTTGTSFGALWLSSHPGTASMGKLLMLSLFWTLVVALLFEPALLGRPPEPKSASPA
jgi:hopanoid biosynthesis associated RND transporter like protein HpnN